MGGVVRPWHTLIIAPSQEMAFEFALWCSPSTLLQLVKAYGKTKEIEALHLVAAAPDGTQCGLFLSPSTLTPLRRKVSRAGRSGKQKQNLTQNQHCHLSPNLESDQGKFSFKHVHPTKTLSEFSCRLTALQGVLAGCRTVENTARKRWHFLSSLNVNCFESTTLNMTQKYMQKKLRRNT